MSGIPSAVRSWTDTSSAHTRRNIFLGLNPFVFNLAGPSRTPSQILGRSPGHLSHPGHRDGQSISSFTSHRSHNSLEFREMGDRDSIELAYRGS
jgi:hypothetical protein